MRVIPRGKLAHQGLCNGIRRKALRANELTVIAARRDLDLSPIFETVVEDACREDDMTTLAISYNYGSLEYRLHADIPKVLAPAEWESGEEAFRWVSIAHIEFSLLMEALQGLDDEWDLLAIKGLQFLTSGSKLLEDTMNWQIQDLKNYAKDRDMALVLTVQLPLVPRAKPDAPTIEDIKGIFHPGIADSIVVAWDTREVVDDFGYTLYRANFIKNAPNRALGATYEYHYSLIGHKPPTKELPMSEALEDAQGETKESGQ